MVLDRLMKSAFLFFVVIFLAGCILLNPNYYKSKEIAVVNMSIPEELNIEYVFQNGLNELMFVVERSFCGKEMNNVIYIEIRDGDEIILKNEVNISKLTFPLIGDERICVPIGFYRKDDGVRPLSFYINENNKNLSVNIRSNGSGSGVLKIWVAVNGRINDEKALDGM